MFVCAGRGPLAGPVVTAACYVTNGVFIEGIQDSKQTKEEEREAMYEVLTNHPDVHWAASVVSHTEIDEVNILQATMNGMRRSTQDLLKKLDKLKLKGTYIALVDGNRVPTEMPTDSQFVIKGDGSIFSIAAASIIAKVTRDRIMLELDKEFPQYNLAQHKGYPTFEHRTLLHKHGPCRIHRTSYGPVKLAMQAHANKATKNAAVTTIVSDAAKSSEPVTGKRKRVSAASANEADTATPKPAVSAKKPRTTAAKAATTVSSSEATSTKRKATKKTLAKKTPVQKAGKVAPAKKATKGKSEAVKSAPSTKKATRASKTDSMVKLASKSVTTDATKDKKSSTAKVNTKDKEDNSVSKPRRSTRSSSA